MLIACARRVPTLRNRTSRRAGSGMRMRTTSSSGASAVSRYAGQNASAGTARSPRAEPATSSASIASSTGSVSPAGEAFATLPPSVPRFWICAAPMVAAAATSAGTCSRQIADRRISV